MRDLDLEREANRFAIELLMPVEFLKKDLRGKNLDMLDAEPEIKKLAARYQVTSQLMTMRLAELGLYHA